MSTNILKKPTIDDTRLGEYSASQPLSGISSVNETFAVIGMGRGGYVRLEEANKDKNKK